MPNPYGRAPLNLTGQKFGKLTALKIVGNNPVGGRIWECRCECGNMTTALARQLRGGSKASCGCLKVENGRKVGARRGAELFRHGHTTTNSRAYASWSSMRTRCLNKNDGHYPAYGGRGIIVCGRWDDFLLFLEDMGQPPTGTTLGRVDNDGGYCKENCRWETPKQQARNRRNSNRVTFRGETRSLAEWCDVLGKSRDTLKYRLKRGLDLAA